MTDNVSAREKLAELQIGGRVVGGVSTQNEECLDRAITVGSDRQFGLMLGLANRILGGQFLNPCFFLLRVLQAQRHGEFLQRISSAMSVRLAPDDGLTNRAERCIDRVAECLYGRWLAIADEHERPAFLSNQILRRFIDPLS